MKAKIYILLTAIILLTIFLRLYKLGQIPPSLHGDELGVGYNAYSLLLTGKDEYGRSWPIAFRADVAPLIFYLTMPTIFLFGLTEMATRLPIALTGIATIPITFLLVKELFLDKKTALLAALFLAISPWFTQSNRITHDANLGLFFQILATWLFVKAVRNQPKLFIPSFLSFTASLYAYHSPRLTTPLLFLTLVLLYKQNLKKHFNWLTLASISSFILLIPLGIYLLSTPIKSTRYAGISVFIRQATLATSSKQLFSDKLSQHVGKVLHHPLIVYSHKILQQYFNYFTPEYLFFESNRLRYFWVNQTGLLYLVDLPLFLLGVLILIKHPKRSHQLVIWWILIAPTAAALTLGPPNPGRVLMFLPMLQLVISLTLVSLKSTKIRLLITLFYAANMTFFLHQYFIHSPVEFAKQWGVGLKEAVVEVKKLENNYQQIIFSPKYHRQPYIFVLFHAKKNPQWLQQVPKKRDSFIGYKAMGKYQFRPINIQKDSQLPNTLLIGTTEEIPLASSKVQILHEIALPSGQVALRIAETR